MSMSDDTVVGALGWAAIRQRREQAGVVAEFGIAVQSRAPAQPQPQSQALREHRAEVADVRESIRKYQAGEPLSHVDRGHSDNMIRDAKADLEQRVSKMEQHPGQLSDEAYRKYEDYFARVWVDKLDITDEVAIRKKEYRAVEQQYEQAQSALRSGNGADAEQRLANKREFQASKQSHELTIKLLEGRLEKRESGLAAAALNAAAPAQKIHQEHPGLKRSIT